MLDAFIIERIRRDRERARHDDRVPLRPERPMPHPPTRDKRPHDEGDRGSVEIDFHL